MIFYSLPSKKKDGKREMLVQKVADFYYLLMISLKKIYLQTHSLLKQIINKR